MLLLVFFKSHNNWTVRQLVTLTNKQIAKELKQK